jgi:hypothetical protein
MPKRRSTNGCGRSVSDQYRFGLPGHVADGDADEVADQAGGVGRVAGDGQDGLQVAVGVRGAALGHGQPRPHRQDGSEGAHLLHVGQQRADAVLAQLFS